jgi:hypothetical protein
MANFEFGALAVDYRHDRRINDCVDAGEQQARRANSTAAFNRLRLAPLPAWDRPCH